VTGRDDRDIHTDLGEFQVGSVTFQPPRGRVRATANVWLFSLYWLGLGVWAVVGSWHSHRALGIVAGVVLVEVALAFVRTAMLSGAVVYRTEQAERIAAPLAQLCDKAACLLPKVVVRDDAIRAAAVMKKKDKVLLVVSEPFIDRVDDRQLVAILAHEVIHIARNDLKRASTFKWVLMGFAFAGSITVAVVFGGGLVIPVYGAGALLATLIGSIALSTLNRPLERRADTEGALL
jgi:Zn-dependent protease with chaperone function